MNNSPILLPDGLPHGRWNVVIHESQAAKDAGESPIVIPEFMNGITDQGIHYLLEAGFRSGTAITAWYAGLIDNAGFTGVDASDVMSSHTGWTENQNYDESVRQTLSFGAAASRAITAAVSFTMNATVTIEGIFVPSVNTKGATTGTLWSTALFTTAPALVSGNVLTANYTLSD
jgi:hypothetical protein